jgi:hypothetical protein
LILRLNAVILLTINRLWLNNVVEWNSIAYVLAVHKCVKSSGLRSSAFSHLILREVMAVGMPPMATNWHREPVYGIYVGGVEDDLVSDCGG